MVTISYSLLLLLSATGGPAIPFIPLQLRIPHQACVDSPLPEVHPPIHPCPYLSGPEDAQHLGDDYVSKDEGPLGVTSPSEYPPIFRSQDGR